MRFFVIVCALAVAACTSEGGPFYEVTGVTSTCEPRTADTALCAVRAEIGTRFPADTLAVVAVEDGERELAWEVIPVADGRGVAEWARVELRSSPPNPQVSVVGTVVEPTGVKLVVADAATTCAASADGSGTLSCRTTGRVECSRAESWEVVVEARSAAPGTRWWKRDDGTRAWAFVRLVDGKGAFTIEWNRPPGNVHSAESDVRALGFVGTPAPRK